MVTTTADPLPRRGKKNDGTELKLLIGNVGTPRVLIGAQAHRTSYGHPASAPATATTIPFCLDEVLLGAAEALMVFCAHLAALAMTGG